MTADRAAQQELLSDEEVIRRMKSNPEVQARAKEALERSKRKKPEGSGITAEELPDFLRDHG